MSAEGVIIRGVGQSNKLEALVIQLSALMTKLRLGNDRFFIIHYEHTHTSLHTT